MNGIIENLNSLFFLVLFLAAAAADVEIPKYCAKRVLNFVLKSNQPTWVFTLLNILKNDWTFKEI